VPLVNSHYSKSQKFAIGQWSCHSISLLQESVVTDFLNFILPISLIVTAFYQCIMLFQWWSQDLLGMLRIELHAVYAWCGDVRWKMYKLSCINEHLPCASDIRLVLHVTEFYWFGKHNSCHFKRRIIHWSAMSGVKKLKCKILSAVPTEYLKDNDKAWFHSLIFRINGTYEKVII
jgi:hypothetical protein